MALPKEKGARVENELANKLWELGYAVVRGPASGSRVRRRYQPDIVALKKGKIVVAEVKTGERLKPIYIKASQLSKLTSFAKRSGGLPVIAVKLKGDGWRIHTLETLELTKAGNAKIPRPESGYRLRDFDELLFPKTRKLMEYMK
ncbi:MAG: Holliday junction resolvase [Desulfurococcales archaeon]|nr:Holliday junction resolvase [Desulfurococcales archaeon]